jgi:hypothetical protein
MKVRIFAFEWFMGGGITLDDFCGHLQYVMFNKVWTH